MSRLIFALIMGTLRIVSAQDYNNTDYIKYSFDPLFPPDIFNTVELVRGWILLYIIGMDFMFIAAAFANDHFIVAALEVCVSKIVSTKLRGIIKSPLISMARSFPKFTISWMGAFLAFSDIGVGTVLGSMAFHSTITIACFFFTSSAIAINWSNFFRDFIFYIISAIALIGIAFNNLIGWYESILLPLLYIFIFIPVVFVQGQRGSMSVGSNQIALAGLEEMDLGNKESQNKPEQAPQKLFPTPPDTSCGCWCILSWFVYLRILVPSVVVWATLYCWDPRRRQDSRLWPIFILCSLTLGSLWVIVTCYFGIWWVTIIGNTRGFPPEVMGFAVIAVFFSIPTTIHVVRARNISDLFGELLTDACFVLLIPALLYAIIFGKPIEVLSYGFGDMLLSFIIFSVFSVIILRCCSNRGIKICFGVLHVLAYFIILSPLYLATNYQIISGPLDIIENFMANTIGKAWSKNQ